MGSRSWMQKIPSIIPEQLFQRSGIQWESEEEYHAESWKGSRTWQQLHLEVKPHEEVGYGSELEKKLLYRSFYIMLKLGKAFDCVVQSGQKLQ